ncbi:YHYH domain-containing protein [Hydrogenophaga sp.]|nr:YHYH domain-containing protein [Hydrogenophaga sp.]MDM7949645.1 YHYH domain-containing protein [Hydrogenophaga sp.]
MKKSLLVLVALITFASIAAAHGGRTNSEGCHNEKRTGGYHCH